LRSFRQDTVSASVGIGVTGRLTDTDTAVNEVFSLCCCASHGHSERSLLPPLLAN